MRMKNVSLGEQDTENKTDNLSRYSLEGPTINLMTKCDGQWEANHKYIFIVYILCSIFLMSSWSMDTTLVFENL